MRGRGFWFWVLTGLDVIIMVTCLVTIGLLVRG